MKLRENPEHAVSNLGKLFLDFEHEYFESIKNICVNNFIVWNILKGDLYSLIFSKKENKNTLKKKIKNFIKSPLVVVKVFFIILKIKKKEEITIFFTKSLEKKQTVEGYYNMLFDFFIESNLITDYLYMEFKQNSVKKEPSFVKTDISTNAIYNITKLISFLFFIKKDIKSVSIKFFNELKGYLLLKEIELDITQNNIRSIIANFYSEFWVYKIIFKILKPKLIILSDEPSTGKSAAAKYYKINTIELQHGLMESYNPRYVYAPVFKLLHDKLISPSCIGVFGNFHKNFLMSQGYVATQKIAILGNSQIERYRRSSFSKKKTINYDCVIFTTQGSLLFNQSKIFLTSINEIFDKNIILKIIPHPGETRSNKNWYSYFASQNNYIFFDDSQRNIYEQIIDSDIVMSFYSTTLIEAIGLSKPAITIASRSNLLGIHSMLGSEELIDVIKPCNSSKESVEDILDRFKNDIVFKNEWHEKIKLASDYLYSRDYEKKCYELIKDFL